MGESRKRWANLAATTVQKWPKVTYILGNLSFHGQVLAQLCDELFVLTLNTHASLKFILQLAQFALHTGYFLLVRTFNDLKVLLNLLDHSCFFDTLGFELLSQVVHQCVTTI